nr:hypothetical protein [Roseospira goensis]
MPAEDQPEHHSLVLQAVGKPEFARVCQERAGGSKGLLETPLRRAPFPVLLDQRQLLLLQRSQASLIGGDQRRAVRLHDPVHELHALLFKPGDLGLGVPSPLAGSGQSFLPQIPQHGVAGPEQRAAGPHAVQQGLELGVHALAANGAATLGASPLLAFVVRISRIAPLRPRGGHGMATAGAGNEAPQREIPVGVHADGGLHVVPAKALLRLPPRLEGDERLVLAGMQVDPPLLHGDVPGIERAGQHVQNGLEGHFAVAVPGEGREGFHVALYLRRRLEAARGEALDGVADDPGHGFVGDQHAAVPGHLVIAKAHGRREHPVPGQHAGAHAVLHLLGILLALVLRDRGQKVFDQDAIRVRAELDGRAFQLATRDLDGGAKLDVGVNVAGQTADVVDDDGVLAVRAALLQEGQHRLHAGAVDQAAGDAFVAEDLGDRVALAGRELAASALL